MLKLLYKWLILWAPFLALVVFVLLAVKAPSVTKVDYLGDKIQRLVTNAPERPKIIIAGDSRAEMNVIPAQLSAALGTSSVNVGVGLGLVPEVYAALQKYGTLNHDSIILISVSSYQTDDGSLSDDDPVDWQVITSEPWSMQKINDAQSYFNNLYDYYFNRIKTFLRPDVSDPEHMNAVIMAAQGYTEKTGLYIAQPGTPSDIDPPYPSLRTNGVKQKAFVEALQAFGRTNDTVIIYESPYAPSIWSAPDSDNTAKVDGQFAQTIEQTIAPYPNMHFVNFEQGTPLPDADFADPVHLNKTGAGAFTALLANTLKQEKIVPQK